MAPGDWVRELIHAAELQHLSDRILHDQSPAGAAAAEGARSSARAAICLDNMKRLRQWQGSIDHVIVHPAIFKHLLKTLAPLYFRQLSLACPYGGCCPGLL